MLLVLLAAKPPVMKHYHQLKMHYLVSECISYHYSTQLTFIDCVHTVLIAQYTTAYDICISRLSRDRPLPLIYKLSYHS